MFQDVSEYVYQRISYFHASLDSTPPPSIPKCINFVNDRIYFLCRSKMNGRLEFLSAPIKGPRQKSIATKLVTEHLENKQLMEEELDLIERKRISMDGLIEYQVANGVFLIVNVGALYQGSLVDTGDTLKLHEIPGGHRLDPKLSPNIPCVSFIRDRDLWITSFGGIESRLTFSQEGVRNGVAEYIMQEEFKRFTGYYWQKTMGKQRIVYLEVDERPVMIKKFQDSPQEMRYPKAGTPNAKVKICIAEFNYSLKYQKCESIENFMVDIKHYFPWMEYIPRFNFLPDNSSVWVQLLSRDQKRTAIVRIPFSFFYSKRGGMQILYQETSEYWINISNCFHFLSNSNDIEFLWSHHASGYRHIYKIKCKLFKSDDIVEIENTMTAITSGEWVVLEDSIWVDEIRYLVYFMAYKDSVLEQNLYVASYKHVGEIKRLTPLGRSHSVVMNQDMTFFTSTWSSVKEPPRTDIFALRFEDSPLVRLSCTVEMKGPKHKLSNDTDIFLPSILPACSFISRLLQKDDHSRELLRYAHLPTPEIFTFRNSLGIEIHGLIFKPFNFDELESYPTIIRIYGGPTVQTVTNDFKYPKLYQVFLACFMGFIVIMVDSIGSSGRGLEFETPIQYQMGSVELEDQIEALLFLITQDQLRLRERTHASLLNAWEVVKEEWKQGYHSRFIDMDRIVLYGWSYGGFLSLLGLIKYPSVFKLVVSGAPVTDWQLYDTAYTERYLGFESSTYDSCNIIKKVSLFPDDDRVMIVHGLLDDNVHFENTQILVEVMEKYSKPLTLHVYPTERHGIRERRNSQHFETLMFEWLLKYL